MSPLNEPEVSYQIALFCAITKTVCAFEFIIHRPKVKPIKSTELIHGIIVQPHGQRLMPRIELRDL